LKARTKDANASLVTTEKDFMRIAQAERIGVLQLRVRAVFDDPSVLDRLLDKIIPRALPPRKP
jgi:tetraacyldisaccharide-1-P 4'-kinase